MSIEMDSQDVRGYLRGLCLVIVVRATARAPSVADITSVLRDQYALDIASFLPALASFTGIDEPSLQSAIDELFESDDEFLRPENLNLQLGLLSGRPIPISPFVESERAQLTALHRPFLDSARNLVHAAVRVRMQSNPSTRADDFWPAVDSFLRRVGGNDELAAANALSTIANVVSDVLFFNSDAATRADDPALARGISRVLNELRMVDLASVRRK